MQGYGQGMNYPRTAYLLTLVGGILILLGAIFEAIVFGILAGLSASVGFGFGVAFLITLAVIALALAIVVLLLAMRLKSRPDKVKMTGILIIVFAIISLPGSGFYLGSILALVGGILALIWTPTPMMQQPGWGQPGQPGQWGQPGAAGQPAQWGQPQQATWGQPTAAPPMGKTCPSCASPNAAGAQFCAKCGAALPA
ncbi:MAG: hypothetical protein L3K02_05645 [Thermoplasmata archaeon]|nr:hypothetical protein [Thermoplasmata archaeon]